MGTGSIPGVKRTGRGVDEPPHLAPRLKKEYSYTSTPTLGLCGLFKGDLYLYLYVRRYRQARFSSRRVRKRVVFKNGDCNVVQGNVAKRRRRYLQDIFTTLVDAQWRWTLLVFALNFLLSWLGFAIIWWLIVYSHGDLSPENNPRMAVALAAATTGSNTTLPSPVVSNWHMCL